MKGVQVSKQWLAERVKSDPVKVIGRALLAIYKNQTHDEQAVTATKFSNSIGFCKPDARIGSIGARQYKAHAKLDQWLIDNWLRPAKDGYPRICKYASQLNDIAVAKCKQLEVPKVIML